MVLFNNNEPFSSIGSLPNGALLLFLVDDAGRSVLRSWSDQLVGMMGNLKHFHVVVVLDGKLKNISL
jgi:hypothetical protein